MTAPAAAGPRARWRAVFARYRAVFLLAAVALTSVNIYVCGLQRDKDAESRALLDYFKRVWPGLHVEVRSIQGGMVGLVDETAPSAAGAVSILDAEIIPSLERVLEAARLIAPPEEAARQLHSRYLHELEAMRADAGRARDIFARAGADLGAQREEVATILRGLDARFGAFYAEAIVVCRGHGIALASPADAGAP